jgi:hypothetical protein
MSASILRAAITAAAILSLAGCHAKAPKTEDAASSGPAAPVAAAQPDAPAHHWVFNRGTDYGYVSSHPDTPEGAPPETPTLVRYLGEQDGVYTIAEVQNGAIVVASCAKPCTTVRVRGAGLDETLPLHPDSIVAAALVDAMIGALGKYTPPAAAPAPQGQ